MDDKRKELLAASSQPKTFKRSHWKRAQLKVKCPPTNRAAQKNNKRKSDSSQYIIHIASFHRRTTENHTRPKRHHKASIREKNSKTNTFGLARSRIRVTNRFLGKRVRKAGRESARKVLARSQAIFNGR
ncbi:hypothetical protein DKX38_012418 [Salix brachista]|uniref:Uncharacterized protein n=1 Tax=Salix brachista TaxID=2182728 RepID=A0A5N5LQS7_9ROSI|nr:hypothetical protein DKX38_012418 [Salix brachista]